MVETINVSVFKENLDTKVGLTLTESGGKIYVKNLAGLFAATGENKKNDNKAQQHRIDEF
jgi:hypothetical protein